MSEQDFISDTLDLWAANQFDSSELMTRLVGYAELITDEFEVKKIKGFTDSVKFMLHCADINDRQFRGRTCAYWTKIKDLHPRTVVV